MQVRISQIKKFQWVLACITDNGMFHYEKHIFLTAIEAMERAKKLAGENGVIRIDTLEV